jgi:hypothetical protein
MKQTITILLMSLMSASAFADTKTVLAKYDCGNIQITVGEQDGKYSVRQTYSAVSNGKKHVVTIDSAEASLKDLEETFQGGDLAVDDNTQKATGLSKGSLAFTGFHYPKGEMYVTAEGETNEEGYTLAVESGLLAGAETVQAASVFWSDWHDSDVQRFTCKQIK